ncbi:hypothetical protein Syun_000681 [Stephania yunnanensis]|uniref:Uncharacterized protein n=1 Tax=Stephania yunnanensis TaxID=152371 RepID=A0AAP0LCP1_9MAGN
MKRRVEEIKEMGERALKEGGSSHSNLTSLIEDMRNQVSKTLQGISMMNLDILIPNVALYQKAMISSQLKRYS